MTRSLEHRPTLASGFCLFFLFLLTLSCAPLPVTSIDNQGAIRDADAQWSKAVAAKDLEGTIAFYSDDATVLPPNAPAVTTKANIRALWASLLAPGVDTSWQTTKVEVARSGELGYVLGTYVVTVKDAQGKLAAENGKLVEVWKKQPDGKWKCVADMYNSDLPPAPAEKTK